MDMMGVFLNDWRASTSLSPLPTVLVDSSLANGITL